MALASLQQPLAGSTSGLLSTMSATVSGFTGVAAA
jgi:hypothetical protein